MNIYHVDESCGRDDRFTIDDKLGLVREGLCGHLHNQ